MKKRLVVLMMSVMVSAMALCGCGKSEESSRERVQTTPVETTAPVVNTDINIDDDIIDDDIIIDDGYTDDYSNGYNDSSEMTLEEYYNQAYIKEQYDAVVQQTMDQYQGAYTDMYVEAYGNTMIYTYVISDAYLSQFDANYTTQGLQGYKDQVISQIRAESGIKNSSVTIEYVYLNENGDVLADIELTD